ncbi:MAG TPA: Gfo/Idh/MocA family oxidoreductase [Candidatus Hydrogenedentes bacterium]|nr:Gfo/Idh/MocA family oxidoreductase [Candidatus Hydrogenedentota bacterium]
MDKLSLSRRAFLAATTTTATAAAFGSGCATAAINTARVVPKKHSPNEKLHIAAIGAGGMGGGDIMSCRSENIVALADVDWKKAEETFVKLPDAKKYKDYRRMLDEMGDQIDACTVSTPDHAHAPAAFMAMNMGIHVRVQKPMTHTIAEARLLRKLAHETGVTTAMGNQGHSGDGVRELCEMVWAGAIGEVKEAHIWTNRPIWPQGIAAPLPEQPVPETMDWDLWINCAPSRPYNEGYAPFKWRGWWDFGCGAIGDMACHIMDPAFWALRLMDASSFTCEVIEQEGMTDQTPPNKCVIKFQFPARAGMGPVDVYWYDGGLMPPWPEGVPADQKLGDGNNGSYFVGTEGVMTSGCYGGESRLLPDERMNDYTRPPQIIPRIPDGNSYQNWIYSIKTGEPASSNFDYAGPLTEVANMGNVALLARTKIEYDFVNGVVTNHKAANKWLTKEYRKGWELPC